MQPRQHIAIMRFGLGSNLDQPSIGDPQGWLTRQIRPLPPATGPSTAQGMALIRAERAANGAPPPPGTQRPGDLLRMESGAWARRMLSTEAPFAERMAEFWSNHFTISRRRGQVTAILGAYQREAIRPHVFGRFEDMLLAVARHPGMIMYLDAGGSIGPNSQAGQRQGRGLNENLAREIMELHTMGVRGGYTQADVTALATIITGWSIGRGPEFSEPDGFMFRPRAHEPGPKTLLGQTFPEGEEGGMAALKFLANHPSTRAFLATKLVRHFAADEPPPAAVHRIAAVLAETQGDLAATSRALLALPEAWGPPLTKLRAPQDYAIAVIRALGVGEDGAQSLLGAMGNLAQPLWTAPGPNGWPDLGAEWAAPEQLMRRLDWVNAMAGRVSAIGRPEPQAVAEAALGPLLKAETAQAIRRAGSLREAMTLLLASPEFQRR
jgi:uncharacterized protein (DUF1800 family)